MLTKTCSVYQSKNMFAGIDDLAWSSKDMDWDVLYPTNDMLCLSKQGNTVLRTRKWYICWFIIIFVHGKVERNNRISRRTLLQSLQDGSTKYAVEIYFLFFFPSRRHAKCWWKEWRSPNALCLEYIFHKYSPLNLILLALFLGPLLEIPETTVFSVDQSNKKIRLFMSWWWGDKYTRLTCI